MVHKRGSIVGSNVRFFIVSYVQILKFCKNNFSICNYDKNTYNAGILAYRSYVTQSIIEPVKL